MQELTEEQREPELPTTKNCGVCDKPFSKRPRDTIKAWHGRKYCSSACYHTTQKGRIHTAEARENIGRQARINQKLVTTPEATAKRIATRAKQGWEQTTPEGRKKRSDALRGKPQPWNRGENNVRWKGGTELRKSVYGLLEYRVWRSAVFERDDYTCQLCGVKNEQGLGKTIVLNADHYPIALFRFLDKINTAIPDESIENKKEYARNYKDMWNVANGRTLCLDCHKKTPTWGRAKKEQYGREIMPLENELHLVQIIEGVEQRLDEKYSSGYWEHQGLLSDKPIDWLIENAIAEAIDQVVYLLTLREKL